MIAIKSERHSVDTMQRLSVLAELSGPEGLRFSTMPTQLFFKTAMPFRMPLPLATLGSLLGNEPSAPPNEDRLL